MDLRDDFNRRSALTDQASESSADPLGVAGVRMTWTRNEEIFGADLRLRCQQLLATLADN